MSRMVTIICGRNVSTAMRSIKAHVRTTVPEEVYEQLKQDDANEVKLADNPPPGTAKETAKEEETEATVKSEPETEEPKPPTKRRRGRPKKS